MGFPGRNRAVRVPAPEPEPVLEPVVFTSEPASEATWFGPPTPPEPQFPEGVYRGRLHCDGEGNLLASEGPWAGSGVYHDFRPDQGVNEYRFVEQDGQSHNQRWHENVKPIVRTSAADRQGEGHHEQVDSGDLHYAAEGTWVEGRGWNHTQTRLDPDEVAATATGHTDKYTEVAA